MYSGRCSQKARPGRLPPSPRLMATAADAVGRGHERVDKREYIDPSVKQGFDTIHVEDRVIEDKACNVVSYRQMHHLGRHSGLSEIDVDAIRSVEPFPQPFRGEIGGMDKQSGGKIIPEQTRLDRRRRKIDGAFQQQGSRVRGQCGDRQNFGLRDQGDESDRARWLHRICLQLFQAARWTIRGKGQFVSVPIWQFRYPQPYVTNRSRQRTCTVPPTRPIACSAWRFFPYLEDTCNRTPSGSAPANGWSRSRATSFRFIKSARQSLRYVVVTVSIDSSAFQSVPAPSRRGNGVAGRSGLGPALQSGASPTQAHFARLPSSTQPG